MSGAVYPKDPQEIQRLLQHLNPADRALLLRHIDPRPAERLLDFTCYTFPQYRPEGFHAAICNELDAVARRETRFLIITAPPQHGKSELASVRFPAFHLGLYPDTPVMIASYGSSLAEDKSSQVRDIVESEEYAEIFPSVKTRTDSRAVHMWKLDDHRAFLRAAGVGGGLTGHGAGLALIDDPFKDAEEANSDTMREKVWSWYKTSFLNRVWPGGAVVIIMTRWHDDDLVGRILNSPGSDKWKVVRLPAIAETQKERDRANLKYNLAEGLTDPLDRVPGEALCPELRPIDFLLEKKEVYSSSEFNSLYQGNPTNPEGNRIRREWLEDNIVDFVPVGPEISRVRYWDKAGSEDKKADYTVGALLAYDPKENIVYIEDIKRGQWTVGSRDAVMLDVSEKDAKKYDNTVHIWHEQEPGSSGKDVAALIDKMLMEFPVAHEPATGSKEIRGEPFATACEHTRVRVVRNKWNKELIDELCDFPNGNHDDQWDAVAGAYNKLALRKKKKKMTIR